MENVSIAAYSVDELSDFLLDRLSERVVLKLREEKYPEWISSV